MKYLFNLICLLVAQKTYNAYLWLCFETLPTNCDCGTLSKKINNRVKIFKMFLDTTRLSPKATAKDRASEGAKLKEVGNDLFSKYYDKVDSLAKQ